jgi:hypothetical protein
VAESSRDYIDLFELAKLAQEVAGEHHRFRFIQLPFNLAMPEAYALANQRSGKEKMSILTAASRLGIAVMGSATLYQARLTQDIPGLSARSGTKKEWKRHVLWLLTAPPR